jgi:alditol oxidase
VMTLTKHMNKIISVDKDKLCVEVEGGITLQQLAVGLRDHGLALENSPSLLQVTAAGCFATGTHGTGVKNCILTDLCQSLTIVCGDGVVRKVWSCVVVHSPHPTRAPC